MKKKSDGKIRGTAPMKNKFDGKIRGTAPLRDYGIHVVSPPSKEPFLSKKRINNFRRWCPTLLSAILLILVGVAFVRFSFGTFKVPTFTDLLNSIANVPVPELGFLNISLTSLGDWGTFEFLKEVFVSITRVVDCLIFFVNGILSVLTYLLYFCRWVFTGIVIS